MLCGGMNKADLRPIRERLLERRNIQDMKHTSPCWLWEGSVNPKGYGALSVRGRTKGVHRLAHEEFVGPIPEGMAVDHLCRVRSCFNPDHLEAVTVRENNIRAARANPRVLSPTCGRGHSFAEFGYKSAGRKRRCRACDRIRERRRAPRKRPHRSAVRGAGRGG